MLALQTGRDYAVSNEVIYFGKQDVLGFWNAGLAWLEFVVKTQFGALREI